MAQVGTDLDTCTNQQALEFCACAPLLCCGSLLDSVRSVQPLEVACLAWALVERDQ